MDVLIELKNRKKLTTTQIAEKTGLHKSLVSRHLHGRGMSPKSVLAYHRAFRIPIAKLLEGGADGKES